MALGDDAPHPLTPQDDDKRDSERIDMLGGLHGEVMVFQPMAIQEISRGGAHDEEEHRPEARAAHRLPSGAPASSPQDSPST